MQKFTPGNIIRFSATLSQVAAGRVDPATISLYVWLSGQPIGDAITPVHDGLGAFHYDYLFDTSTTPGKWIARYASDGGSPDATALSELVFTIAPLNT